MATPIQIPVLPHLRGIAALLVFVCHFGGKLRDLPYGAALVALTPYSERGVEMFFAISGFVIPLSMYQRGHRFKHSGSFLLRRIVRLEPPYLASIAVILCLNALTQLRAGSNDIHTELRVTVPQLLAHFAYLNAILHYPWLNAVFWTLAIEFQFYIFMVFAYPLMNSAASQVRIACLISTALIGLAFPSIRSEHAALLPSWLPLFALGMTMASYLTHNLNRTTAMLIIVINSTVAAHVNGMLSLLFAAIPLVTISCLFTSQPWAALRPLSWVGSLSYSFYLIHLPIGLRIQSHAERLLTGSPHREILVFLMILSSTLCCSLVFHRLIEKPSQRFSAAIGPRNSRSNVNA